MKKNIQIGLSLAAAVIVIGSTGVVIATGLHTDKKDTETAEHTATGGHTLTNHDHFAHTIHAACEIFNDDDARAVLGNAITKGAEETPTSSVDMKVTTCSYSNSNKTANVVVRAPLTDAGIDSNESAFGPGMPRDAETVEGYGSDAYWSPSTATLNIFREHSWIIIYYGELNPTNHTLTDARKVADKIFVHIKPV